MRFKLSLQFKLTLVFMAILVFAILIVVISTRFALIGHFQNSARQYGYEMGMMFSRGGPRFISTINRSLFLVGAGGSVIALILAYYFSQSFLRPIKEIISNTKSISSGNYTARIRTRTNDEMDELVGSLNNMFESLEKIENTRRDLIANMSHELLTPLTNIYGYLEAIQDGIIKDGPQKDRTIHTIKEETEKLILIIKESKKLSLLESDHTALKLEKTDLGLLLEKIVKSLDLNIKEKKIVIKKEFHNILINADKFLLEQALLNIIKNALNYSFENAQVYLSLKQEGNHINILVKDYGKGIGEEEKSLIFERFYRSKKNNDLSGLGIGLTIALKIIKMHMGDIEVKSQLDKGSTFTVRIPADL